MRRPIAISALFLSSQCFAQPPDKPVFEAVSIRPGSGRPVDVKGMLIVGMMRGGPGTPDPERLTGNSMTLRDLILSAYTQRVTTSTPKSRQAQPRINFGSCSKPCWKTDSC